jgi:hypothetical protein
VFRISELLIAAGAELARPSTATVVSSNAVAVLFIRILAPVAGSPSMLTQS